MNELTFFGRQVVVDMYFDVVDVEQFLCGADQTTDRIVGETKSSTSTSIEKKTGRKRMRDFYRRNIDMVLVIEGRSRFIFTGNMKYGLLHPRKRVTIGVMQLIDDRKELA